MAFTTADLDAIDRAIAAGELTVRFNNGDFVTYQSAEDLLARRTVIQRALDAQSAPNRPVPRHMLADFRDE